MNTCSHPPNVPPVTVHQIIRYLGSKYAHASTQGRHWAHQATSAMDPEEQRDASERCYLWNDEASIIGRIIRDIHHGAPAT